MERYSTERMQVLGPMSSRIEGEAAPRRLEFTAGSEHTGRRLDSVLAELSGITRSRIASLIERGEAGIVGQRRSAPSTRLRGGDALYVELLETASAAEPAPVDFDVVYEDDQVAVISKPSGIAVHPGAGETGTTLVSGLLWRWPGIVEVGQPGRPGIVHRLDSDVSGLMVVALRPESYERLVEAFAERSVRRTYLALVEGRLEADLGRIEGPVGRDPRNPTRRAVVLGGKPAATGYARLAVWEGFSLAEVSLETGRTHQIRVHLEAIGHPIVGDPAYGRRRGSSRGTRRAPLAVTTLDRPFLHAARLELNHPASGERMIFTSELPPELVAVLSELGSPLEGEVRGPQGG